MNQNSMQQESILDYINIYLNDDIKKIIYNYYINIQISFKHNINNHLKLFFSIKPKIQIYVRKTNNIILKDYYIQNYNSYDSDLSDYDDHDDYVD